MGGLFTAMDYSLAMVKLFQEAVKCVGDSAAWFLRPRVYGRVGRKVSRKLVGPAYFNFDSLAHLEF